MKATITKSYSRKLSGKDYTSEEFFTKVEKEIEYKMLEEQINRLIEQLPPARRNIYMLSRVKNLPNKEIAALLDISENTVESQLNKANQFMRKNLLPYCNILVLGLILLV